MDSTRGRLHPADRDVVEAQAPQLSVSTCFTSCRVYRPIKTLRDKVHCVVNHSELDPAVISHQSVVEFAASSSPL